MPITPKILIVDDEPLMLRSLRDLLGGMDYDIHTAATGREGIERVSRESFDLVLLDIGLPDMDGFQVMDRLCRNSPRTRVVIITGHASIESALEAIRRGAYNYLRKPFQYEELVKTVTNALEHKRLEEDRRRAEEALREREELLRLFVAHTPAAVAMFDREMRHLAYSRRWLEEYGGGHADLIGRSHYEVFPQVPERWKEEYGRCFQGEIIKHEEEPFPGRDGGVEFVRRELYPWKHESGRIGGIIVFSENITDRKRAEEALRESEERFREVVENSLIGISIIQDARVVFQNPEQRKIFGPLPRLLVRGELDFIHPDDREKVRGFHNALICRKAPVLETDFRFFPRGDSPGKADMRWVQCRASFFTYRGREAILVNTVDVTRAKELEHLVTIKDKMMSLGRVAAGIAHEIRNPLTGINTYLYSLGNLCEREEPDPESLALMKQIIGQIQHASNKIESVIKRVLDFSKPSVPRMRLTDINGAVRDAVNLSAVTLRKGGVRLDTSLSEPLPRCYADPHLIEQVILNLINNAHKAMEQQDGPRSLEIATAVEGESILIDISDSGPGVPEGLRAEIFDPFFTTNSDGSGIGLSLVQRIITDHNGSVSVGESRWGGALFRIELPIERRKNPR
ncbi:MAG: hypothetical protein DRH20_06640 [Deltaproteobacteria bacterium]|nr:MAG: hypothetical protein DRH20_06640 [Deltaproteobacteria bacterium]